MPSPFQSVGSNGWKAIGPWMTCLGFSLIALPALAIDLPDPVVPDQNPDPESSSELKPGLTPPQDFAERRFSSLAPAGQSHSQSNSPRHPSISLPESARPVALQADQPRGVESTATLTAIAATQPTASPAEPASASGVAAAEVIVTEACLADCNPNEQFRFNAPTNIAIPPRTVNPRPFLAETPTLPVPAYPPTTSAETVPSPPPLSTPQPATPSEPPTVAEASAGSELTDEAIETSSRALTPPSLQFQGVYIYQGDEDAARFRVTGVYPILPELQIGGTLDFTEGDLFSSEEGDGLQVNELYVAASIPNYPNLRFIVGQIDLTSYFDRNSFAKDSATQFFNPLFATNPALTAAGIGSRQGAVVNWTIIDEIEVKAAAFSSDRSISDFDLNAFAGEIGVRLGNLIVRGTYSTAEDAGANTTFEEAFSIERSNGEFGVRDGDREDGYGVNAEYFIPEINLGLFARYGWYENRDLGRGGSTYSFGINLLDLFMEGDRLGLGYGQELSDSDDPPDVFEAFYDFRIFDSLRLGVTFQGFDGFSESIAGFRIRTDFDLVPRRN